MFLCDYPTFCKSYLPFNPTDVEVDGAIKHLLQQQLLIRHDASGRYSWAEFDDTLLSKMEGNEKIVFKKLEDIAKALSQYTLEFRTQKFSYLDRHNSCIALDIEGSTNFTVDACFEYKYIGTNKVHTANTAVIAKFTFGHKARFKNRMRLISAADLIMDDDPRRTGVYGITIEDDMVSLWYFSRSHLAKSEEFSFVNKPEHMIRSFLSFMFATDEEIGYDPKVFRRAFEGEVCYVYQVQGRYFRTVKEIFSYPPSRITGRMTRVWEACEVKSLSCLEASTWRSVAVKDVWLAQGTKTEHQILNEILASIKEEAQKGSLTKSPRFSNLVPELKEVMERCLTKDRYKDFFMPIECSELGITTRQKPENAILARDLFEEKPKPIPASKSPPKCLPKQHYFLVYSEVGTQLDDVPDLLTAFRAMKRVVTTLVLLYIAGWVHRDISTGNILCVEYYGEWCPMLSDLEYAKRFNPGDAKSSSNEPIGTPQFMALEVAKGGILHPEHQIPEDDMLDSLIKFANGDDMGEIPTPAPIKFFYNYEHDLESLWWIAAWFILCRVDHKQSNRLGAEVFTEEVVPNPARERFFWGIDDSQHARIHPDLTKLFPALRGVSRVLYARYRDRARRQETLLDEDYSKLYSAMWSMLRGAIVVLEELEASGKLPALCPEQLPCLSSQSTNTDGSRYKRKRTSSLDDDETRKISESKEGSSKVDGPPPLKRRRSVME